MLRKVNVDFVKLDQGGQGFTLGHPTPHIDAACPPILQANNRQPHTTTWAISDGTPIQRATHNRG